MADLDVLICAYNEAPRVPRILESLRRQTSGTSRFRVLFVDNNSTDGTPEAVEAHRGSLDLLCLREQVVGLNAARNAGYRNAAADYVAHIDADAEADPKWVETILRTIDRESPDLLGGPYFPFYEGGKPAWFQDRYNAWTLGDRPRPLDPGERLNGTNMIWRRAVVERLGGFRDGVGLRARGLARGDETDLMERAFQIPSFRAWYSPEVVVFHLTRPETLSLWYWIRRFFVQGRHDARRNGIDAGRATWPWFFLALAGKSTIAAGRLAGSFVWRKRAIHPCWRNYAFERTLPAVGELGRLFEAVAGERRTRQDRLRRRAP